MSATIDHRSNVIPEVVIGTQTWASQNYDFAGDPPNGDYDNITAYGKLYTWDEAVAIAAGIDGWHLPSGTEWNTLMGYLGGSTVAGGYLKEAGTTHWDSPNIGADNSSGFTAVAAGGRRHDTEAYEHFGVYALFWSSTGGATEAGWWVLWTNEASLAQGSIDQDYKCSVRLIKD